MMTARRLSTLAQRLIGPIAAPSTQRTLSTVGNGGSRALSSLSKAAVLDTVPTALIGLDFLGTAAFAASGCLVAGQAGMDTLGCCFVGTITALGGGTVRDVLLGRLPVFWMKQTSLLGVCIATCLATFFASDSLERVGLLRSDALQVGDTIGVGAFAVVGAQAALGSRKSLAVASVCGMLTATCGGLVRDVLCARKNQGILYSGEGESGLYAPTALAGAALYGLLKQGVGIHPNLAVLVGVGATVAMRAVACSCRVRLPPMRKFEPSAEMESAPQPQLLLSQSHLFVTAYGPDMLGHVAAISKCISHARANVSASKIITIGDDIAFMMVVSTPSDLVESLSKALNAVGSDRGLAVSINKIDNVAVKDAHEKLAPRADVSALWRARIELIGTDSPGLVHLVSSLLAAHGLNIQSLDTRVYSSEWAVHPGSGLRDVPQMDEARAELSPLLLLQQQHQQGTEMSASRSLRAVAEGDVFCLSAIVSSATPPEMAFVNAEFARLERTHGVRLRLTCLSTPSQPEPTHEQTARVVAQDAAAAVVARTGAVVAKHGHAHIGGGFA